jgi:hypothetical protein
VKLTRLRVTQGPKKKLPEGTYRNYVGFLIKDSMREIEVNEKAVEEERPNCVPRW